MRPQPDPARGEAKAAEASADDDDWQPCAADEPGPTRRRRVMAVPTSRLAVLERLRCKSEQCLSALQAESEVRRKVPRDAAAAWIKPTQAPLAWLAWS